ncbi:unnamed protein product [Arabidopsis halleri]
MCVQMACIFKWWGDCLERRKDARMNCAIDEINGIQVILRDAERKVELLKVQYTQAMNTDDPIDQHRASEIEKVYRELILDIERTRAVLDKVRVSLTNTQRVQNA